MKRREKLGYTPNILNILHEIRLVRLTFRWSLISARRGFSWSSSKIYVRTLGVFPWEIHALHEFIYFFENVNC